MKKKILCMFMASMMVAGMMTGCSASASAATDANSTAESEAQNNESDDTDAKGAVETVASEETKTDEQTPKYIFLFIGDGMSYPQIQLTNYFLSANENKESAQTVSVEGEEKTVLSSGNNLTMMNFPVAGSAQTYDSTSFAPDSASTATSIATGNKTWSGSINVSTDFTS